MHLVHSRRRRSHDDLGLVFPKALEKKARELAKKGAAAAGAGVKIPGEAELVARLQKILDDQVDRAGERIKKQLQLSPGAKLILGVIAVGSAVNVLSFLGRLFGGRSR